MSYQNEAVITSRLLRLLFVVVHDVISHTQLQQKQEDDQPTDPNPMEAHRDGHGQKSAYNSRRTNRLPTPKTKKTPQKTILPLCQLHGAINLPPPTDEHPFNSRRNHTHLTQKASRVLVSKVAFGCREYGAKRSS